MIELKVHSKLDLGKISKIQLFAGFYLHELLVARHVTGLHGSCHAFDCTRPHLLTVITLVLLSCSVMNVNVRIILKRGVGIYSQLRNLKFGLVN